MNKPIYKYKGQTVWRFDFLWTDDSQYNQGFKENKGTNIGTQKAFDEGRIEYEKAYGFTCWNIKKRHATKEEYERFIRWL